MKPGQTGCARAVLLGGKGQHFQRHRLEGVKS